MLSDAPRHIEMRLNKGAKISRSFSCKTSCFAPVVLSWKHMLVICVYYVICDCWKHILTDPVAHATWLRSLRRSPWVVGHVKKLKITNLSESVVNSLSSHATWCFTNYSQFSSFTYNILMLFFLGRVLLHWAWMTLVLSPVCFYRLWRVSLCPVSCISGLIWYSDTSSRDLRPSELSMSSTTWLMKEQSTSAPFLTPCSERWVCFFL